MSSLLTAAITPDSVQAFYVREQLFLVLGSQLAMGLRIIPACVQLHGAKSYGNAKTVYWHSRSHLED